jgi:hypothetical protein
MDLNTIVGKLNELQGHFEFVNISDNVYEDWYTPGLFLNRMVNTLLEEHVVFFKQNFGIVPELVVMDINAGQCCVHRSRLLRVPRHVWKHLCDISRESEHHNDYGFEGLLHVIMGEEAVRPYIRRHFEELRIENPDGGRNELELLHEDVLG